ncbi:perlucin-like [Panulirus ornatus]|uniref:perlucin-like n=1 Tax=Panulirus ornatus TaxID=150431 RepID=UPI003A86DA8F
MNHTLQLFLLLSALAAAQGACPNGFHIVGNQCYRFSQEYSDTKTWEQARTFCQFLDSDLAVLDLDCNDNNHLISYIISKGYTNIWVGASDTAMEGFWKWVDNRVVDMTSTLWFYNEPDNPSSNDCARFVRASGDFPRVYLYDHPCSQSLNYICQTGIHSKQ